MPNAAAKPELAKAEVEVLVAADGVVLALAWGRGTAEASAAAWAALDLFFLCLAARGVDGVVGGFGIAVGRGGRGGGDEVDEARRKAVVSVGKVGRKAKGVGA